MISIEEVEQFRRDGFLGLRQVCAHDEILEIRKILDDLYARKVGASEGALFDVLKPGEKDSLTLGQLTNPSDFAPALRKTAYAERAQEIAKQILGPRSFRGADFVLMKPALNGAATPWHQDQAYRKLNYDFEELTIWLPLQAVDESSGCMQFVPGTHLGPIKPHRSPNNDVAAHAFESCYTPSVEEVVSVPMVLGDCSIHDGRVLHGSPPNRSTTTRYAYIQVFRNPASAPAEASSYSWVHERQDVNQQRREDWLRRGGYLVMFWRKLSHGEFSKLWVMLRDTFIRFKGE